MTRLKCWSCLAMLGFLGLAAASLAGAETTAPILRMELGTHNAGI